MKSIIFTSLIICALWASTFAAESTTKAPLKVKPGEVNKSPECQKILKEYGVMVKPTLLIRGKKFPQTIPEIDEHCKLGQKLYKGFNLYKKCLTGLGRQALVILNHGIRKFIRSICNTPAKKEAVVRDLKCATNTTLPGWSDCLETVDRQLVYVSKNSSDDKFIGNLCCIYTEATECIKAGTGTMKNCDKKANTTKFFISGVDQVLKEVLDFVCGRYQYKEDCEANNADGLKQLRKVAARKDVRPDDEFLIGPVIEAVVKLGRDDDEDDGGKDKDN
ncbi:uncharacterized protein LOC141856547 [Brevipalpus obovatus]|uniref:uncharacterized protein LOC141856547 n=1 Tax=Brevipalpus obovatus TaxID=246614 RepID=UPI003D9E5BDB